MRQVIQIGGTL